MNDDFVVGTLWGLALSIPLWILIIGLVEIFR
jgi:hypothetical protein